MFLPAIVLLGPPLLNRLLAPTPRALPQRSALGETQPASTNVSLSGTGPVSIAFSILVFYGIYKVFFAKGRR